MMSPLWVKNIVGDSWMSAKCQKQTRPHFAKE